MKAAYAINKLTKNGALPMTLGEAKAAVGAAAGEGKEDGPKQSSGGTRVDSRKRKACTATVGGGKAPRTKQTPNNTIDQFLKKGQ